MSIIASLLLISLMLAIAGLLFAKFKGKAIPMAVIFVLGGLALCLASIIAFINKGENYQAYKNLHWQPLAPEKIAPYVEQGFTVFVDITADWCVPCQANKANVLHREQVVNALMTDNIILMQGNWSKEDTVIEQYMGIQGAAGTPYNKVYGPAYPDGIELPKVLEIRHVYQALDIMK
ncbi:thioredoxin family protein [Shewanella glacialimarina]|jgi:thiol:disulfide interchange protein|uniref:thioredoxin family protein n=1 Tax=Shewanella glacialimarina TaxID=2590884 RepID=UPI001CF8190C|nr:thioredoxin family protein [Shewanella glacialimarina]UCX03820.1 thiol:disulfide interchange protein [Shewanella glacialimarina]